MSANESTQVVPPTLVGLGENVVIVRAEEDGAINWARYFDHAQETVCDLDLRGSVDEAAAAPERCGRCSAATTPWIDRVSVRRQCEQCPALKYDISSDPSQGPTVKKGEEIVVPAAVLRSNLFLTGGASFTQRGVDWLARTLFASPIGITPDASQLQAGIAGLRAEASAILDACPLLESVDRGTEEGFASAMSRLTANPIDPGMAALLVEAKAAYLVERLALASDPTVADAAAAAWSLGVGAAYLRFKVSFEEAAYRGHSLEKLRRIVSEWSKHRNNSSEQFWQELLLANPIALSQLFSAPVVIHGDRFLVGGVRAGGRHGKIADYLLKNQLTDAAVIVEIKTPCTSLLYDAEYRQDVFAPSRDLSGAVQQILEQRAQFMKSMNAIQAEQEPEEPRVEVVEPHSVVIIGDTSELSTRVRRRAFEAYRTELRNVRVVTFDELFGKLRGLIGLLGGKVEDVPA